MFCVIKFDLRCFLRLLTGFILSYGKFIVFENKSGLKRNFCSFSVFCCLAGVGSLGLCCGVCLCTYARVRTSVGLFFDGGSF